MRDLCRYGQGARREWTIGAAYLAEKAWRRARGAAGSDTMPVV